MMWPRYLVLGSRKGTSIQLSHVHTEYARYYRPAGAWYANVRKVNGGYTAIIQCPVGLKRDKVRAFPCSPQWFASDNRGYLHYKEDV